jgi:L-lactate utilization protein LutC
MAYDTIPARSVVEKTMAALQANGIETFYVEDEAAAKAKVHELIPDGADVMTMTSRTTEGLGLDAELNESGQYASLRGKLYEDNVEPGEKRRIGAAADYVTGSVHAVTEDGEVVIASNTGSQLPAYAYAAGTVVWVVGTHKIVADLEAAKKRIYDYVLPLEAERARQAYGVEGSNVSKLLIISKEVNPHRLKLIFVNKALGF